MKLLTYVTARTLWMKGVTIWLCPSESYPNLDHPFNVAIPTSNLDRLPNDKETNKVFKSLSNSFKYYNCTSETGLKVHYYKAI